MAVGNPAVDEVRRRVASADWPAAEQACRNILEQESEHLEILNLLAGILSQQEKLSEAVVVMKRFVDAQPPSAPALCNLGYLYGRAGMVSESAGAYAEASRCAPQDPSLLNHLGIARLAADDFLGAAKAFGDACRLLPGHAGVRRNLADALYRADQFADALPEYEKALRLAPKDRYVRLGLARCANQTGDYARAAKQFELLLQEKDPQVGWRGEFAGILFSATRFDEAKRQGRQAIGDAPDDPAGYLVVGNVLREQGDYADAAKMYQEAIDRDPSQPGARYNLSLLHTQLGSFEAAILELEHVISIAPRFTAAYYLLGDYANQGRFEFSEEQLATVRELIQNGELPAEDVSSLGFTLGGVLETQEKYDEAFATYAAANRRMSEAFEHRGQSFHAPRHRERVDRTIATWNAEHFDSAHFQTTQTSGLDTEVPTFVVGMPRSGTTLVEQILAAHPLATGVGELTEIGNLAGEFSSRAPVNGNGNGSGGLPDGLSALLAELASQYLATTMRIAGADSEQYKRIVDKTPGNSAYLGLIASMFPKARIIECRRDARDISLSCYFRKFNSLDWTWDLEDIGHVYNDYLRTMRHWHEVLLLEIHVVDYERLISEPESTTRSLVEFCGLPWDDACLEFYKGDQAVRTASQVQVRRPIYSTSVARWKRYAEHLGELERVLE